MLQELLVLAAELLAGGLEAVDLVELVLLLGERLADDLAGLGVGLVADAVGVVARLGQQLVSGLLGDDEDLGDLALGGGEVGGRRRGGAARWRSGDP